MFRILLTRYTGDAYIIFIMLCFYFRIYTPKTHEIGKNCLALLILVWAKNTIQKDITYFCPTCPDVKFMPWIFFYKISFIIIILCISF